MPVAARRLCAICPAFAIKNSRCDVHQPSRGRGSSARQGYGGAWRRLRVLVLAAEPYCRECSAPSTQVDHITPRSRGGSDDPSNLQALCARHHSQKTARQGRGG